MLSSGEKKIDELMKYVNLNLKKGFSRQQIRNALVRANYNGYEIEESFRGIK